jgi:hypothetical protein
MTVPLSDRGRAKSVVQAADSLLAGLRGEGSPAAAFWIGCRSEAAPAPAAG